VAPAAGAVVTDVDASDAPVFVEDAPCLPHVLVERAVDLEGGGIVGDGDRERLLLVR
jgi:hypothetical protein